MRQIIPTAEPFFFHGKNKTLGCLLIHGFTGAPKEMRWMGEFLAEHGYTSLGIRLAGHATHPDDMIRTRFTDWLASVEDGLAMLNGSVERIVLIGLSMGGILALLSATRLDVTGVIAISTPYSLPHDPRLKFVNLYSLFHRFRRKTKLPPGAGWFDKQAFSIHVSYPMNPVRSIGELNQLMAEMRAALPQVDVPVLLVHSKDDTYVPPHNLEQVYMAIGSRDKEKMLVNHSGHVATEDAAHDQIFEASLNFIRRIEGKS